MTLQIELPTDLESRLHAECQRQGLSPADVALRILRQGLPPNERAAKAVAMLEQWAKEDEALTKEEYDANAEVLRQIDLDRLSDRKLFEDILKREVQ